ncbi:unnamed protein product [Arctia plantaginis]|uniref:PiggyBac transposable element-derived protein domain-containing protein n=1 Tax=Arctia plantaginis TaxID=874455 RepID=A0A8S0ZAH0_ARCPL|nr:unnamed protein product [Arctia plantaginis]
MSKRCRRKLINNIIDDEEELGGKSNSKLPIFEKQSPPNSNTKPTWASKPSIEDSSDEEIFPIKRLKNSDSLQIEENKTSYLPKESGSPQKVNIFEEIKQTDIRKQKLITNKHANFFIITSTGKLYNKAKIGVEYAKNNDERNPVETNELEETIYLSPNESENTENDTLDEEEALPSRQINKNDDDEWIDISESPVNFDEFVGENTYNIPSFVKSSEDVYKLFVTEEMINKMVSETNNYARNYLRTNQLNMKRKSRMKHWTDTNLQEMKTFLAVVMAMGLCKVPLINLYWSKNNLYRNEFISSAMTRDRFLLLLKCWHVSDVSNDDKTDKLYKIRDMLSMITVNFQNILNPGKYVVIDETMIPWRGRLGFRQYIKNKSHRYGVKLYKLCTPEGYTYQIEIYTGKTDQKKEVDHSQKVVLRLMNNLIEQGRIVIVDNFYTSVTLAEKLLSQKTFVCGTLNVRRKYLQKKVVNANIKKGQIIGKMNKKGVKVLKWVDKRNVLMLTTCKDHDDKLIDTGKKKRGTNECIKKPGCVIINIYIIIKQKKELTIVTKCLLIIQH